MNRKKLVNLTYLEIGVLKAVIAQTREMLEDDGKDKYANDLRAKIRRETDYVLSNLERKLNSIKNRRELDK